MGSSTKVIRRICKSCKPSHRDVYYKRITSVPDSLDLVEVLKDSFTSENNLLGVDFTMYSKDKYGTTTTQWNFVIIVARTVSRLSVDQKKQFHNNGRLSQFLVEPMQRILLFILKNT